MALESTSDAVSRIRSFPTICTDVRHCARSRKFACLILDGVIGIVRSLNTSGHTTALESPQPLPAMSTRDIARRVKAGMHSADNHMTFRCQLS